MAETDQEAVDLKAPAAAAPPHLAFSSFSPDNDPLRGIGGWLVLMILGIALRTVLSVVEAVRFGLRGSAPALVVVAIDAVIAISGGYTCVMLLRQRPHADRIAIGWYLLNAALAVLILAITIVSGRRIRAEHVSLLGYALMWIVYLRKSDRVRLTYRSPPLPSTAVFD